MVGEVALAGFGRGLIIRGIVAVQDIENLHYSISREEGVVCRPLEVFRSL